MYVDQYNQTNNHIDVLTDMLHEIRSNIFDIINVTQPRRPRVNRNSRQSNTNTNTNTNRTINQLLNERQTNTNVNRSINRLLNERQHNFVRYDYQNPIDPVIYSTLSVNDLFTNNTSAENITPTTSTQSRNNDNTGDIQCGRRLEEEKDNGPRRSRLGGRQQLHGGVRLRVIFGR